VLAEIETFLTGSRPAAPTSRVLATVLFTDIADSTGQATRLGDERWRALLARHRQLVREGLDRHDGREIRTTGDGFVVTFDGPGRAVRCAVEVVDGVRDLGLEVRAGVHTGEIERLGDDISGIAVHIAARVTSAAPPSRVWTTGTVRDLVIGSGIEFAARGEHDLKGVPGTWTLHEVTANPVAGAGGCASRPLRRILVSWKSGCPVARDARGAGSWRWTGRSPNREAAGGRRLLCSALARSGRAELSGRRRAGCLRRPTSGSSSRSRRRRRRSDC